MVFFVRKINPFESCGQIYVAQNNKTHAGQPAKKKKDKEKNYDITINVNPSRTRGRSKTETTETTTTTLESSDNTLTFSSLTPHQSRRRRHEQGLDKHVFQSIPYPFPNAPDKSKKQPKSRSGTFISSLMNKGRTKNNNTELEMINNIKQDHHFQSMIGILAQLRAVCKVTMEISAELTSEVNKIGHKVVAINHRLEAARRKTLFHIPGKTKEEPSASVSRLHSLALKEHERARLNELGRYPDPIIAPQKPLIVIPEALKHRYDKRCHKDPQFHHSSDRQLLTITSIIFKDYKDIPNGPFCSFMHDVEVLNWVKSGHMSRCAEMYSFPKLFQLKWNERNHASIRASSIGDTFDNEHAEHHLLSDPMHSETRPPPILLTKKGKTMPKIVENYLNHNGNQAFTEDKHASANLTESLQFFKELSFGSSSTRTSTSSCSNGTVVGNLRNQYSFTDLIESQIFRHVDGSVEWQMENEKKKPRNKRDSLIYINEEYYAKKRCRDKLKESLLNYQNNKRIMEELKALESDDEGSLSDTGSVVRVSKASFSTNDRPRPSSIDTIASAINIDFDDSPPNVFGKHARLSTRPYYNYLVNPKHHGYRSDSISDEDSDNDATQTETLSNLPSIFNIIEESKKNTKKNVAPTISPLILNSECYNTDENDKRSSGETNRRKAILDMDGEELTILHTLRTEDPLPTNNHGNRQSEDDRTMDVSDVAFSFGPITTLTQEVISIDRISDRVQKSKPLIQSHLHSHNRSNIPKRNIDNNHPVLGKVTNLKIVHPFMRQDLHESEEEEYSSTDDDTDTMSDFPRSDRIVQPSSVISDASLMETTHVEPPVERLPISMVPRKENQINAPPPKISEQPKSLFKDEVAHFRTFRPSNSTYSSTFSSLDEGGFLDSVVLPKTQVSTTNSKPKVPTRHHGMVVPNINHMSPSIDFDLPSSYEYSLKIMELEQKKHVYNSQFLRQGNFMSDDDENYTYSEDDHDGGMYHVAESHQSRYIPSDSSFSDTDSF